MSNFLLVFGAAGTQVYSQTLTDVLCNLNAEYTDVTALVPSMYTFMYDGTNNIGDGGNDMYDGGNILNTNVTPNIPYSDDAIIASTAFGTTGEYFTRHLPGLFVMVADIDGITSFSLAGNNGADGGGFVDDYVFSTTLNSLTYNVFVKRVYGTSDPSINEVIIVPENSAVSHTWSTNTNDGQHAVSDLTASTRIYYFLVASASGGYIDNTQITAITDEFLTSVVGGSSITINATGTLVCEGESVTLTGSGGSGAYTWDNGITDGVSFTPALGTQTYTVSATALNGCVQSASIDVTTQMVPVISVAASDEIGGTDGGVYVTLIDGLFPFTYDWDNDGTGDFDDPQNLTNVGPGTYTVVVSHANGCEATASATVNSQVGIEENGLSFQVYPNPVAELVVIELPGSFAYRFIDMTGKVLLEGNGIDREELSLADLSEGSYLIEVYSQGQIQTLQVVKNK